MLAALDLPQPVIMLLARWGSDAILKYVADAPLSRLTEAYLERVQAASVAVLGAVPSDAPAAVSASPAYSAAALALADASATSLWASPRYASLRPASPPMIVQALSLCISLLCGRLGNVPSLVALFAAGII